MVGVPDDLKKYFKPMPRGNWVAKKNSKLAREFGDKIRALIIELDSPFPLIEEETGFRADIVFDMATRRVGHAKVLPVGDVYFLQIPSLSDKPPIDAKENYEPTKAWGVQRAIDEYNRKGQE